MKSPGAPLRRSRPSAYPLGGALVCPKFLDSQVGVLYSPDNTASLEVDVIWK